MDRFKLYRYCSENGEIEGVIAAYSRKDARDCIPPHTTLDSETIDLDKPKIGHWFREGSRYARAGS